MSLQHRVEDEAVNITWLPVDSIKVDPEYQRALNGNRVRDIARNFRWAAFEVLTISQRGDSYWVVNGQHRLAAAKMAGMVEVPCIVLRHTVVPDEAGLFVTMNGRRGPLKANDLFRAKLAARDPDALAIVRIAAARSLRVSNNKGGGGPRAIAATASLEWVYAHGGEPLLGEVLDIIEEGCAGEAQPWLGELMKGLATFLHVYHDCCDRARLVRRLSETSLTTIRKRITYYRDLYGDLFTPNLWARALVDTVYNYRLQTKRLPLDRLDRIRWGEPPAGGAA